MFKHLTLRKKLVAVVLSPIVVLATVALCAILLGFRGSSSPDGLAGDVRMLGLVAFAAAVLSGLVAMRVSRTITEPLSDLSDVADEMANVRLPQLVESLRNPGSAAPSFEPMTVDNQTGEIARLIVALNTVQESAAEVAGEQKAVVQAGVTDLVVNLARRSQSLLDRQIECVDSLESNEEDPERLEQLFALDHLATRMRRNAESLLVVAGAEAPRRRGAPVAVADVLRVAMSEIEDYRRVSLTSVDAAFVGNQPAADLAHLLSELMENATSFSPPDTTVEVKGIQDADGYYLISVSDLGIGMNDDQLDTANTVLANPPELGLGLSRSLGFIVIGRLARRLGVQVELARGTAGSGITALVLVPTSVLAGRGAATGPVSVPLDRPADLGPVHAPPPQTAPIPEPMLGAPPAGSDPFEIPAALQARPVPAPIPAAFLPNDEPTWEPATFDSAALPSELFEPRAADPVAPIEFQSEALAELLGKAPDTPAAAPVAPQTGQPSDQPSWDQPSWDQPAFDAPVHDAPVCEAPVYQPPAVEPFAPASLAQAIPDGEQFDAGVASLLQPGHPSTYRPPSAAPGSGLAKRDRSHSQAPPSEGRPVAPSVRSPEEIRQMLARYRDGRNRPSGDAGPAATDAFSHDPFNPGGQA
ncbi:MAG: hypothetical protein O3C27_15005 [Actinomycetota bacterium]|nr:hypothetical protein [Actinomycetota bacterium]